jgi:hypothetical protein
MSTGGGSRWLSTRAREYYGGLLMVLIGLGAIVKGVKYQVGTLTQMGAGYFPVALGVILVGLGVWIAGVASRAVPAPTGMDRLQLEWRGWLCILGGIVAFVVIGDYGGLVPATFAIVFISALGDRTNTWRSALVLAVGMSIVCVIVFWWALQVQFPLFAWGQA